MRGMLVYGGNAVSSTWRKHVCPFVPELAETVQSEQLWYRAFQEHIHMEGEVNMRFRP